MAQEITANDLSSVPSSVSLITLGHGTLSVEAFVQLVTVARIEHVIDVRSVPRSRRNPQFAQQAMSDWLPAAGLVYRWEPQLGGFRRPDPHSINLALHHPAFRGFADYMLTPLFWHALEDLLTEAAVARCAIMCSESLWWRCHRRLIADAAVLTRAVDVQDLFHDGRFVPHRVTDGARVKDGLVVYDVVSQPVLLDHP